MALRIPPPSRIAIGSATINGQQVEVSLSPEWARYFESLTTVTNATAAAVGFPGAPGTTGAAGVGVALSDDAGSSMEFIPGPRGETGAQGERGPFGISLDDSAGSVEFVPGPAGPQGLAGKDAAALFMLMETPEPTETVMQGASNLLYAEGSWVPVITSGSGTITSYTINYAKYTRIGNLVICTLGITITNNGTGAANVTTTLPFTATYNDTGVFRENAATGIVGAIQTIPATATAFMFNYNNTYPGATGAILEGTLVYRI